MMQTFTVFRQEYAHWGFRAQRLKQLNERAAQGDHRLLDSLLRNLFAIERLDLIPVRIQSKGGIEVLHGNGHVVEIEEFHLTEGIAT